MRTTFRVIAAAFALLLATPALGASEFDIANAEHDANGGTNAAKRVTIVDSAGTSVIGTGGGVGSRVELLASGTSTATGTAYVQLATLTVPTWAHSVVCHATVESVTVGPMTGWQLVGSNRSLAGTAMGSLGYVKASTTTPSAGVSEFLFFGNIVQSTTAGTASGTTVNGVGVGYSFPMTRSINFGRELTGIPTAISIDYACYAYGG